MTTDDSATGTIGRSASHGAAWLFGLRIFDQLIKVLRLVVIARLIVPEEFGVLGVALLALAAFQTFTETGVRLTLVQRKDDPSEIYDSAWTVQLLRGLALAGISFAAAPWIGAFFDSPASIPAIRWLALMFVLEGISNVATVEFQRSLRFGKQFAMQIAGTLVDFVVTVVLALLWQNVFALVLGLLAGRLTQTVAGYLLRPYRPRLDLDGGRARELWTYGRWIAGTTVLLFLGNQADDLVVGKVLGVAALAYYQLAYRVAGLPATEGTRLITAVLFPALSRLQEEPARMRAAYLQALQFTAMLSFPVAVSIFLLAPKLTVPILGEAWAPAVLPMQILGICGMFRSIVGPGPLFMAEGRPRVKVESQALGLAVLALSILPLVGVWGIAGAAIAATARAATGTCWLFWRAWREMPELRPGTVRGLGLPALAAGIAGAAAWAVGEAWGPGSFGGGKVTIFLQALLQLCVVLGGYYVCLTFLDRRFGGELRRLLIRAFRRVVPNGPGTGRDGG